MHSHRSKNLQVSKSPQTEHQSYGYVLLDLDVVSRLGLTHTWHLCDDVVMLTTVLTPPS